MVAWLEVEVIHAVSINHELNYRVRVGTHSNGPLFLNLRFNLSSK